MGGYPPYSTDIQIFFFMVLFQKFIMSLYYMVFCIFFFKYLFFWHNILQKNLKVVIRPMWLIYKIFECVSDVKYKYELQNVKNI